MPSNEIALTEQESKIIKEVQTTLGFNSMEATIEYLARERIKEMLGKLAGQEIKRCNRDLY